MKSIIDRIIHIPGLTGAEKTDLVRSITDYIDSLETYHARLRYCQSKAILLTDYRRSLIKNMTSRKDFLAWVDDMATDNENALDVILDDVSRTQKNNGKEN